MLLVRPSKRRADPPIERQTMTKITPTHRRLRIALWAAAIAAAVAAAGFAVMRPDQIPSHQAVYRGDADIRSEFTLIVSIRRRPWARRIDQRRLGAAFGLRGFGAHFFARRSKLSRMRPISASSGSNCPPYHSSIWLCSSCLGSAMASRKSA